jgi:hypothetical protein
MKRIVFLLIAIFGFAAIANASLVVIGTATYKISDTEISNYQLIYDSDAPNGPIVWLDYRHGIGDCTWNGHMTWAASLNNPGVLTYNLLPEYQGLSFGPWRLPSTVDGASVFGYNGTTTAGYNIITSEMGHLYYIEFKNPGSYKPDGTQICNYDCLSQTGAFPFLNLPGDYYYSGTENLSTNNVWFFSTNGEQGTTGKSTNWAALAVSSVNVPDPVTSVIIDIKPGSYPNTINLGSAGVVPVAIISTTTFDATQVKPETVALAGAKVKLIGKGNKYSCHSEDVNGDGLLDLVCQVVTAQFMIEEGDSVAALEASTYSGQAIRGQDSIRIVP